MFKRIANETASGIVNNFTIANIITITGLILDLWNNYLIYNNIRGFLPLFLLWAVPFSDLADGWFARRRKGETRVGEALDPIRDKIYVCSKFAFMIMSFIALCLSFPIIAPLTIIVYSLLAFLELLLLLAGCYGLIMGYKIKANEWGKKKTAVECFILGLIWGPIFLFSRWGLSLDNLYVLILLTIFPIVPIYLALKSLEGHITTFKEHRNVKHSNLSQEKLEQLGGQSSDPLDTGVTLPSGNKYYEPENFADIEKRSEKVKNSLKKYQEEN